MEEIQCPNCGRSIKGKAELCLFCGTRIQSSATEDTARGKLPPFLLWLLIASVPIALLCCVLIARSSGVLQSIASMLQTSPEVTVTPVGISSTTPLTRTPTPTLPPTPTPEPTAEAASPTNTPSPTPTPNLQSPTPTPTTTFLPDTGQARYWPFVLPAVSGVVIFLSWLYRLTSRKPDHPLLLRK